MNWSPKTISGTFHHGKVHGIVELHTPKAERIYLTANHGVLEGPVHSFGCVPLLDYEVW